MKKAKPATKVSLGQPVTTSEVVCPCCRQEAMVFWRGRAKIHQRMRVVEWLACGHCGRRTDSEIVCDGPYRYELVRKAKALGDRGTGIRQGGA
jgi:Zn ribbon nucleic-acid-binding protein